MISPAVSPNLASTPASAWIRSSRMKSTSAPVSGCGSVTNTTSNAFGSSWRRRALGLMMAVETGQIGLWLERRHEAGGLDDEDRRLVRQGQRIAAVGAGE